MQKINEYKMKNLGYPIVKELLVIIPAYNERKNIAGVLMRIKQNMPASDILVIDDGSSDGTAEIAENSDISVLVHPFNLGYGAALQTGYKYALTRGYEYVVQLDADGQHETQYINDLLSAIKKTKVDVVIGSRFLKEKKYKIPFIRRIGMIIFSKIATIIIRQKVTDSTSGFRALNRRAMGFLSGSYYPADYPDADVIILLHYAGFQIKEIPVIMHPPSDKKSMHAGFKTIYYIFKMFLSIIMTLLRKKPEAEKED